MKLLRVIFFLFFVVILSSCKGGGDGVANIVSDNNSIPSSSLNPAQAILKITSPEESYVTSSKLNIQGECDKTISDIAIIGASPSTAKCIDGKFLQEVSFDGIAGIKKITITQTNKDSNNSYSRFYIYDFSPPVAVSFIDPVNYRLIPGNKLYFTSKSEYTFSWNTGIDYVSGVKDYLVKIYSDGSCSNLVSSEFVSDTSYKLTPLTSFNTIEVSARDFADNLGASVCSHVISSGTSGSLDYTFGLSDVFFSGTSGVGGENIFPDGFIDSQDRSIVIAEDKLVRFNANGALDNTFSNDGILTLDGFMHWQPKLIKQLSNGKYLVGGSETSGRRLRFVRINQDGSYDLSFATLGEKIINFGNSTNLRIDLRGIAIGSDGAIYIAGFVMENTSSSYSAVVKFYSDGDSDSNFQSTRLDYLSDHLLDNFEVKNIALQPDGKLVLAGHRNNKLTVTRLSAIGGIDSSFGGSGLYETTLLNTIANKVEIEFDGKIIVAGSRNNGTKTNFYISRLLPTGILDGTFNSTGAIEVPVTKGEDIAYSFLVTAKGEFFVTGKGESSIDSLPIAATIKLTKDGLVDSSFGSNGVSLNRPQTMFSPNRCYASAIGISSDDKIVLMGNSSDYFLIRLLK